jgi:hypothetical protein
MHGKNNTKIICKFGSTLLNDSCINVPNNTQQMSDFDNCFLMFYITQSHHVLRSHVNHIRSQWEGTFKGKRLKINACRDL